MFCRLVRRRTDRSPREDWPGRYPASTASRIRHRGEGIRCSRPRQPAASVSTAGEPPSRQPLPGSRAKGRRRHANRLWLASGCPPVSADGITNPARQRVQPHRAATMQTAVSVMRRRYFSTAPRQQLVVVDGGIASVLNPADAMHLVANPLSSGSRRWTDYSPGVRAAQTSASPLTRRGKPRGRRGRGRYPLTGRRRGVVALVCCVLAPGRGGG